MRIPGWILLLGWALAGCSSPSVQGPTDQADHEPVEARTDNVLIVYVDTLRPDHLGAYGYQPPTSAFIDQLAAEGARFSQTYAPTPWTYSSTASLFTGLYPAAHGAIMPGRVRNEATQKGAVVQLSTELVTMADIAEQAGVKTALIARNRYLGYGLERGFGTYQNVKGNTAADQTDAAIEWLDDLDDDDRFLLVVHYMDIHTPNKSRSRDRQQFPAARDLDQEQRAYYRKWQRKYAKPQPELIEGFEVYRERRTALYDASIHYLDGQVERLVASLGDRRATTLVVLTADHGEEFWEHADLQARLYEDPRKLVGVGHGHTFFEEVVRIPLIVHQPGVVEPRVVDDRASLLDVLPTVAELMRLPDEAPREGHSLVPALAGEPVPTRPLLFDAVCFGNDKQGILLGDHKYVRSWNEPSLLLDLGADPAEQIDLTAEQPDKAQALAADLELMLSASQALGESIRAGSAPVVHEFTDEELLALEALGYVWGSRDEEEEPSEPGSDGGGEQAEGGEKPGGDAGSPAEHD